MSKGYHIPTCLVNGLLYTKQNKDCTAKQLEKTTAVVFFHTACTS